MCSAHLVKCLPTDYYVLYCIAAKMKIVRAEEQCKIVRTILNFKER